MAKRKEYTHIVLKWDDVEKYLNETGQNDLDALIYEIELGRKADGKCPSSNYIICNTDEPYADKVLQVILDGEDEKQSR